MFLAYSPPKRKQNKNQIKKTHVDAAENPINSTDESKENTALGQSECNTPGGSRQSPNMNQQMQKDNSQDTPGVGQSQPPPEGRGQGSNVNTPPPTVEQLIQSPLFNHALQPIVGRMNVIEDTMNVLLDKINGLVSRMIEKGSEGNDPIGETHGHPNDDEIDYSADDETVELSRQSHSKKQQAPVREQNRKANHSSNAFASYSGSENATNFTGCPPLADNMWTRPGTQDQRSNPSVVRHGSVERELRHVHFHSSSYTPQRSNLLNANAPTLHLESNASQPPIQSAPYLIKVKIGQPLPNGQIVDEEIFVTEQQYRQMLNPLVNFQNPSISQRNTTQSSLNDRARSVSRASTHSFNPSHLTSSTQYAETDRQSPRSRRGNLSWRSSDSSDDDEYNHPVNLASSLNTQARSATQHASHGGIESRFSNINNNYQHTALKIGQVVNSWKISFPRTEKDPEQFLLILKDLLSSSGIQ